MEDAINELRAHMAKLETLTTLVEQIKKSKVQSAVEAPVEAPVEAVEAPVEAVEAPVEAVEAPVEAVEAPVEAPVEAVEAPVEAVNTELEETKEEIAQSQEEEQEALVLIKSVVKVVRHHKKFLEAYFEDSDSATDHHILYMTYDVIAIIAKELEQLV